MIVTEEQALKMRCCGPEGCGDTRFADYNALKRERFCFGSKCMAWFWSIDMRPPGMRADEPIPAAEREGGCHYVEKRL